MMEISKAGRWVLAWMLAGCLGGQEEGTTPELKTDQEPQSLGGLPAATRCDAPEVAVDRVDLLFVMDNSPSMVDEQEKLKAELPLLVHSLTTGMRADGSTFRPVRSLHLGVVTTNMGVPGLTLRPEFACDGFGDDGRLMAESRATEGVCAGFALPEGQTFLSYEADSGMAPYELARQFGCLVQVGTGGCGFEMQLEAALKALAPGPGDDIDLQTGEPWRNDQGEVDSRYTFLTDATGDEQSGHGGPSGANAGFLRDGAEGPALLVVVMVSDENDCSSSTVRHFQSSDSLPPADAYLEAQPLDLRCHLNQDKLQTVQRYVQGLQALRPGNGQLVLFAAITGVPEDAAAELATVDRSDAEALDAAYDRLLDDPRMEPRIVADGTRLEDACTEEGRVQGAEPGIRYVQVARGFGENGLIQSICAPSFQPAMNGIIDLIGTRMDAAACEPPEANVEDH